nr:MAG TPA: hypothetical protein [Caudoviricetes sp.]
MITINQLKLLGMIYLENMVLNINREVLFRN